MRHRRDSLQAAAPQTVHPQRNQRRGAFDAMWTAGDVMFEKVKKEKRKKRKKGWGTATFLKLTLALLWKFKHCVVLQGVSLKMLFSKNSVKIERIEIKL